MKKMNAKNLLAILWVVMLAACNNSAHSIENNNKQLQNVDINFAGVADTLRVNHQGLYGFSVNMLQKLVDSGGNSVASPLGVAALYRMLEDGAEGDTKQELNQIFDVKSEDMSLLTKALANSGPDEGIRVEMANLLAIDSSLHWQDDYKTSMKELYLAEVQKLNFRKPSTLTQLNKWIEDHTHGKIKNGIDSIDDSIKLSAVNTIYFKGSWFTEFNEDDTNEMGFDNGEGLHAVDMMSLSQSGDNLPVCNTNDFQVVRIPYDSKENLKVDQYYMYVLLPHKDKGLQDVMKYLREHSLEDLQEQTDKENDKYDVMVNLWLPKFEINSHIDLKKMLSNMGMKHFDGFTKMTDSIMSLSESYQKATIDVNEKYTEAAAMTAAVLKVGCFPVHNKTVKLVNMRCDHPFIYFIINESKKKNIFMGVYQDALVKRDGNWISREYKGKIPKDEPLERIDESVEIQRSPVKPVVVSPRTDTYDVVDEMPKFPGGHEALLDYLKKNVRPQKYENENYRTGRVVVAFVVEKDGSLSDFRVVRSVDPVLDKEALRVAKTMPKWIPGKEKGTCVKVRYNIPVKFDSPMIQN